MRKTTWIVLSGLVGLIACADSSTAPLEDLEPQAVANAVAVLGFSPDGMVRWNHGVVVEGDIYLSDSTLRRVTSHGTPVFNDTGGVTEPSLQYMTSTIVGSSRVRSIKVDLAGLSSYPTLADAVRDAMGHWGSVPGVDISMVEQSPGDITVTMGYPPPGLVALASWPYQATVSGGPGPTIVMSSSLTSYPYGAQVLTAVHELGHTIGFHHDAAPTIGPAGPEGYSLIYGTPLVDSMSVMHNVLGSRVWVGFTPNDRKAAIKLYPLGITVASASYPGGVPTVTWDTLPGAVSYELVYDEYGFDTDARDQQIPFAWSEIVSVVSSPPAIDPYHSYTGYSFCSTPASEKYTQYLIRANFPDGSTHSGYLPAKVCY